MFLGRVVQPGEPLWLPEDIDLALAYQALLDDACPGCGHPRSESMDPAAQDAYTVHRLRCHACEARDYAARMATDPDATRRPTDGLFLYATRDPD